MLCCRPNHAVNDNNQIQRAQTITLHEGVDPTRSRIFVQSHVPAHAELCWLLSCITPMNWLERMIQYKEKSAAAAVAGAARHKREDSDTVNDGDDGIGSAESQASTNSIGTGLFTYPVLMAADILLYQATQVPVGEDQRQHLELARDICRRFAEQFGPNRKGRAVAAAYARRRTAAGLPPSRDPVFVEPTALLAVGGARVMALTDGTRKMSKSDPVDASRINLLDPPAVIRDKIKRCKTDATVGLTWDDPTRPEATNLLTIYAAVSPDRSRDEIAAQVAHMTWGEFKPVLAEAIVAHLQPIQERYYAVRQDEAYLHQVLADGAEAANAIASQTLRAAKVAMGFVVPKPPPK